MTRTSMDAFLVHYETISPVSDYPVLMEGPSLGGAVGNEGSKALFS